MGAGRVRALWYMFCVAVLCASCAQKPEEALIGCWNYPSVPDSAGGTLYASLTFSGDGRVWHFAVVETGDGGVTKRWDVRRRYAVEKNGCLLIEMPDGRFQRYAMSIHFGGRKMTLDEVPGGRPFTLKKEMQSSQSCS